MPATATRRASERVRAAVPAAQFRAALEQALATADADQRTGPLIAATRLRMRFEFTDCGLTLNVASGVESGEHNLRWSFDEVEWEPKLTLSMSSTVANRYLQGAESLAIAIAHGEVRVRGESRIALLYLPATQMICEPYRRAVEADFPALAISKK